MSALKARTLRALVLDEADQLMSDGFYTDIAWVHEQLPSKKQVLAFSATYTPSLLADIEPLMHRPQKVLLCQETVSLQGIRQFYKVLLPQPAAAAAADQQQQQEPQQQQQQQEPQQQQGVESIGLVVDDGVEGDRALQQVLIRKVDALLEVLSSLSFHQVS